MKGNLMRGVKKLVCATSIALGLCITILSKAADQKSQFEPMVGNGTNRFWRNGVALGALSGPGGQEVELGSSPLGESVNWNNPVNVFSHLTEHLPKDIQTKAWGHFAQKDGERGLATVEDARNLAKLYQHESMKRIKKENAAEKLADADESNASGDGSSCVVS